MALRRLGVLVLLGLGLAPGFGTVAASPELALRLGIGDRVNMQVFGQPELSGEFVIDTQGNIVLPIGGAVPSVEVTLVELQQRIVDILADGFILRPRVSIRALELRPVYVMGDVRISGALPFRVGMTALAAIAMSGGPASTDPNTAAFRGDLVEAEERVGLLESQRAGVRARIARLEAQQNGATAPAFPEELLQGGLGMQRMIAGELAIFDGERGGEARQADQITRQHENAEAEMASLGEQIRLERGQLEVSQSYQREMAALARTGMVNRSRVVDSQREVARLESSLARITTESARVAQVGRDAPLRLAQLRGAAEQRAAVGLLEARARLVELENGIAAGREQIALRSQRIGAAASAVVRPAAPPKILITRMQQAVSMTFAADERTPLKPGDILRVSGVGSLRFADGAPERPIQPDARRQ